MEAKGQYLGFSGDVQSPLESTRGFTIVILTEKSILIPKDVGIDKTRSSKKERKQ
jgi:hypothetical protein